MKVTAAFALFTLGSASAFAPAPFGSRQSTTALSAEQSRSGFLAQSAAAIATLAAFPATSNAAKYGSFGAGSPEVIDPSSAIIDQDILASESVQKCISGIRSYLTAIKSMSATVASDSQADIGPSIRKELDFVQVRADFNGVTEAFDEDTQRGTDRLVRIILQDITELETANKQKPGVPRSEKRLSIVKGKLAKLEKAFDDFLAFV
uniref:Uncharacterized protein n=1 Tax=Helicotheca tamesis TaxID=374047 RepID=A0A6U0F263_9STRA|mmetsp:Transcript_14451/g.19779  ORF Transcript_14451/g.19779 Transcript_14451/m.19779 type:complete len:206 (+) Transcript_14451:170-787(+)|eukprot:CAMPEP_0185726246 /NCGR_PEP_ID=MMETSP1171-20130828/2286_1 /TAXON_ID=374046 /ORGANISM="Helicotheca tamensis, Strain CCMP826" /LENGTH=205 /DNA_ID=CAMNT_0028394561 /DNA_START=130 /DNA_END=747 /DNA_ORIENTATION=+